MTKQELADLSDARLIINNTLPETGTQETFSRILDSWQEKDRKLECVCANARDLLAAADEAVKRYSCRGYKCGTALCPQGYECQAYALRRTAEALQKCLEGA